MEKNSRRRKAEDGFHHLERSCYCCKRQSGLEETSQRPYSPRGDIGKKERRLAETKELIEKQFNINLKKKLWNKVEQPSNNQTYTILCFNCIIVLHS